MNKKPPYFQKIETFLSHECTSDGTRYVRFSENNWAQWMGESLEIIQSEDEIRTLEAAYALDGKHFK